MSKIDFRILEVGNFKSPKIERSIKIGPIIALEIPKSGRKK